MRYCNSFAWVVEAPNNSIQVKHAWAANTDNSDTKSRTRPVNHRLAKALRMAAQALFRSQSWLGQYFRRMRAKLGAPKAITAAAHKLAPIVFHMLTTGQAYDETIFAQQEVQNNQRMQQRHRQQAKQFGFQLVEITAQ